MTGKLEAYDFAHAVQELYSFFWRDLCDWYLEIVKPRLYEGEAEVSATCSTRWSGCSACCTR